MKRKLLPLFGLAALAAIADILGEYNTWQGWHAGENAAGDRTTVQGAAAASNASAVERSVFIGAAAGAFSADVADSVAIGHRALRYSNNSSNVVAIGSNALAGRASLTNATWINGHFFSSKEKFFIKHDLELPDENSPIYFSGDTLYLNASNVVVNGVSSHASADARVYDLYMSAEGNDENDGLSPATAKRTFQGCYDAALGDATVGVLPGTYAPLPLYSFTLGQASQRKASRGYGWYIDGNQNTALVFPSNNLHFVAIDGPERTVISGDGQGTNALAMAGNELQIFQGFAVTNLAVRDYTTSSDYPVLSGVRLVDCVVSLPSTTNSYTWGVFIGTEFCNTSIRIGNVNVYHHSSIWSGYPAPFRYCRFDSSRLFVDSLSYTNTLKSASLFRRCSAASSLFVLPAFDDKETSGSEHPNFLDVTDCTFLFDAPAQANVSARFFQTGIQEGDPLYKFAPTNCYFCVGGDLSWTNEYCISVLGDNNVFAPFHSPCLDSGYVPTLQSPAVRYGDFRDAGWKNSGLSVRKSLLEIGAALGL